MAGLIQVCVKEIYFEGVFHNGNDAGGSVFRVGNISLVSNLRDSLRDTASCDCLWGWEWTLKLGPLAEHEGVLARLFWTAPHLVVDCLSLSDLVPQRLFYLHLY